MSFEFKLPDIGEGVVEGEIVKWLVKPGDALEVDQPMVEVMTDKATVVIPSPTRGVVVACHGGEGDVIKVHSLLVTIDDSGGARPPAENAVPTRAPSAASASASAFAPELASASSRSPSPSPSPSPSSLSSSSQSGSVRDSTSIASRSPRPEAASRPRASTGTMTRTEAPGAPRSPTPPASSNASARPSNGGSQPAEKVLAAPATRRLARELGVDITQVPGTGPAGRVTSDDIVRVSTLPTSAGSVAPASRTSSASIAYDGLMASALPTPAPARGSHPISAPESADEVIPVRGLRRRIWENMAHSSLSAAHFTFVDECDATELVGLRDRFNAHVGETETRLTYLPFIIKAVIASLRRYPMLNGHVDDEQMTFIRRSDFHIGIAVASERGLVVPVIRHAARRSMLELAQEISRLSEAVRSSQIRSEDLGGSTFTITSLGKDGGIFATPIINYPEVAIMGVHKLRKRPVVLDDDEIAVRQMMNLSLSFDHRLIDGHVGAAFTMAVIRLLESPERMLIETA